MIKIALLGASGMVGQKIIELIYNHPFYSKFELAEIAGSEKGAGRPYLESNNWKLGGGPPSQIMGIIRKDFREIESELIVSALPTNIASEIEPLLLEKGHLLSSNASFFRMHPNVPLILSGVNDGDVDLVKKQHWKGKIVTNPNCVVAIVGTVLRPILEMAPLKSLNLVTLQSLSGAGYPGVPSLDLIDNTIPFIDGEEEKIEEELKYIFSSIVKDQEFSIMAQCHRVPVTFGHTATLNLEFKHKVDFDKILLGLRIFGAETGRLKLYETGIHPQPKFDLGPIDTVVHIGRIKINQSENKLGLVVLGHNLVRGAAALALDNLEALKNLNLD